LSYQGSDLTEREWGKALDDSVNWNREQISQCHEAFQPTPARDLDARALAHTQRIAESDPAYAWWASNHYQRLGQLSKSGAPMLQDLPQQFIDFENQPRR